DVDELNRLRNEHAELLRLRGQATASRQHEQELARAQSELRLLQTASSVETPSKTGGPSQPALAEGLKPVSEWNQAGFATPSSAFETCLWAKERGDTNMLARAIMLDANARAR